MCDTLVVVKDDRIWFAKNSDRDPNEAQVLRWVPAKKHNSTSQLRCTWRSIPQVEHTHAVLLSSPFWMWGAEMGTNEHGVVIGNQAVFTKQPLEENGLLGMDILRLALERAWTSDEAVELIKTLIMSYGQGGRCGYADENFSYHNSFLVADANAAWLIETAGRDVNIEQITSGVRAISNGLSTTSMRHHAKKSLEWLGECKRRRSRSEQLAGSATQVSELREVLADHGPEVATPQYKLLNGALSSPCAHAGGALVSTQTVGSWISELRKTQARHWATATSAPCLSLFKPVAINAPITLGSPTGRQDPEHSFWWEFEAIHRQVIKNYRQIDSSILKQRDALEAKFFKYQEADQIKHAWHSAKEWQQQWLAQLDLNVEDRRTMFLKNHWNDLEAQAERSLLEYWQDD